MDSLVFDIRLALKHHALGTVTRKFIRSLTETELHNLCRVIADHPRRCRWAQLRLSR
ncbi:MAG TPA: hypothetical protein VLX85_05455 [Stellaceae bacterium]|nr:hypothetical protein [Stellaceae bacterium]